ncbi:MAG: copper amine oxidase [Paenibacillus sp.]|jgi:hypothetical protein|nr:copper amine oxidase [Paenibacillus sp.]
MKNRTGQTWLALMMAVLLVVLAGCQPVNGLDLNKVFQNGASVKSFQGTQSVTLELMPNDSVTPSQDEQKLFDLFSKVKISLTEMKQQDMTRASAKGVFEYNKGQIPFQMTTDGQSYTFLIEGAKKPVVFQNSMAASQQMDDAVYRQMQEQISELTKKMAEWSPSLASYILGNMPNPKTISVSDEKFNVGNEGINGKNIHLEIKGSDLPELAKSFLTNVLADEKGMKELLGQIYDLYTPVMQQSLNDGNAENNAMNDAVAPFLNDKTLAVEFAYTFVNTKLREMLDNYDQAVQDMMSSATGEHAKLLLNESQYLKMDVLVDQELMPRKSNTEIMISHSDSNSAVKSVKFTSAVELWNINKPVEADKIDTSAGQLELTTMGKPAKIVSVLDPESQLYGLLKHDLNITKKEIMMSMNGSNGYDDSLKPYNRNGVVMVPVRFVVEELDADVTWDAATQKVTVTDLINGAVINLNIGSKQASVNGMIKPLEAEAELTNGSTYVPVRFIAESMGTKVSWEQDSQTVIITRD